MMSKKKQAQFQKSLKHEDIYTLIRWNDGERGGKRDQSHV